MVFWLLISRVDRSPCGRLILVIIILLIIIIILGGLAMGALNRLGGFWCSVNLNLLGGGRG